MVHSGGMSESETGKTPIGRTASTVWVEPTGDGVEAGAATTATSGARVVTEQDGADGAVAQMGAVVPPVVATALLGRTVGLADHVGARRRLEI